MENVSGLPYMFSKEGILRSVIVIFHCVSISLITLSGRLKFGGMVCWVMSAYVISWIFTSLSYFLIATSLNEKIKLNLDYKVLDATASVFSFCHYSVATIVLSMYTFSYLELIGALVVGIMTSILYFIEAWFGKKDFPKTLDFVFTKRGTLKSVVCFFGILTSAMLDASGHECYHPDGCDAARKWALAAFIISMLGTLFIILLYITGITSKYQEKIEKFDFCWSAFSCLNYLIAALILSCYMKCLYFNFRDCAIRLASNIFGFVTCILYAVEAYFLKNLKPIPEELPVED